MVAKSSTFRRLGTAALLLSLTGTALAGCSGDDEPDPKAAPSATTPGTAASPDAGASQAPKETGAPIKGKAVDGERLNRSLVSGLIDAKGCTMKAEVGAVTVNGEFTFGKSDEIGFISKVNGAGDITSGDDSSGEWIARLGQRYEGTGYFVNDGKDFEGKPWARVPRSSADVTDPQTLVKEHPLYLLVPQAIPLFTPDTIASLISVRKGLVKVDDSTEKLLHYAWNVDGSTPTVNGSKTYHVWVDTKGRPTKFTGFVRGTPLKATYGDWGKRKEPKDPPSDDVAEVPNQ